MGRNNDGHWHILIAEDNHSDVFIINRGLYGFNPRCRVHHAADGEQLLAMLGIPDAATTVPSPDLIIIDLYMPRMYGLQALQQIKRDPRYLHTPCIVMSSLGSDTDRAEALRLGARTFIPKPASTGEFRRTVSMIGHILMNPDSELDEELKEPCRHSPGQ